MPATTPFNAIEIINCRRGKDKTSIMESFIEQLENEEI